MPKVKRFSWAIAPGRRSPRHILRGLHVEGELTDCGVRVQTSWRWARRDAMPPAEWKLHPECMRCLAAAK